MRVAIYGSLLCTCVTYFLSNASHSAGRQSNNDSLIEPQRQKASLHHVRLAKILISLRLIRIFTGHILDIQVGGGELFKVDRSNCSDVQAD